MSFFQFLYLQSIRFRRIRDNKSDMVSFLESKGYIYFNIRKCYYVITQEGHAAASDHMSTKWVAWLALAVSIVALIRTF